MQGESDGGDSAYRCAYCESSDSVHDEAGLALSADDANRLDLLDGDAALQAVVDRWARLPAAVRAGILAMVRAAVEV